MNLCWIIVESHYRRHQAASHHQQIEIVERKTKKFK